MKGISGLVLPKPEKCQLWIDFDGTISKKDTLDELISRFSVDDSWKEIERQWRENLIGSRECLEKEFSLLRVSDTELENLLDSIGIDNGLYEILDICERLSIPVAILSDGVDFFIKRILSSGGISDLTVRSNTVKKENGAFLLVCPHNDPVCKVSAAHCKCSSMKALGQPGRKNIYIGDGRSDLCPARKADFVFAKNVLAQCLREENANYIEYANLRHVSSYLTAAWQRYAVTEESIRTVSGQ
jgi:2-hydroxy-3-keto-5-methylthiopentenyl-1-phosphate phosphatase